MFTILYLLKKGGITGKNVELPMTVTRPQPTEEKSIQESDIVIAINSKTGKLLSPQCRIYVNSEENLRQVGLIRKLSFKANSDDINAELKITFPLEKEEMSPQVKESLRKNTSLLAEKGCLINLSDDNK
jgi:hypothetical protein